MIVMDIIAERVGFPDRLLIPPFIKTIACNKGRLFFQRCAFEKIRTDFAQNL